MDESQFRLEKQLAFILEIDKLKTILRQTHILDRTRRENDAEHTWHLTMMAIILLEHAKDPKLDLLRVLKMLIVHDLVEIDAGDTFAYDTKGYEDKEERELKAAQRLFGMLPKDQEEELMGLWKEFENRATIESKYANALDRLQPMLFNYNNDGDTWKKHGISSSQVLDRNKNIADGSEILGQYVRTMVRSAIEKGYIDEA
jgi:putative hydrolases of HD superfamily